MTDAATELKIGDVMGDGSIYAGICEGRRLYTTPADAKLTHTFNEAQKYVRKLNWEKACGHDDWRVPTKKELDVLYNNKAAIGGFNETGSWPAGWYWSSTQKHDSAWTQCFGDGGVQDYDFQIHPASLRCVRG